MSKQFQGRGAVQRAAVSMAAAAVAFGLSAATAQEVPQMEAGEPRFVAEPFLQNPTPHSVSVVWMTSFAGTKNYVVLPRKHAGYHHWWDKVAGHRDRRHHHSRVDHPSREELGDLCKELAQVDSLIASLEKDRARTHGFVKRKAIDGRIKHERYKKERLLKRFHARWNRVETSTRKLQRVFDDASSRLDNPPALVSQRQIWRHEAVVRTSKAQTYFAVSVDGNGEAHVAGPFRLQPLPKDGEELQILLSSDQQERFNSAANYQVVAEMFPDLDAVFFAGDLVNHPRRAAEWFDNFKSEWRDRPTSASPAFFPVLQGTFGDQVPASPWKGGEIMQNVPLFPSIGNHETSGRFRPTEVNINTMFGDPQPRWYAEYLYKKNADQINPKRDPKVRDRWIRDHSHDSETYREIFTFPDDAQEGGQYYSKKFGDVFVVSMNVSRIWRTWNINDGDKSKFREALAASNNPEQWGFGDFIFEPFNEGTKQFKWLKRTLASKEARKAKYRVVMFHQSATGLGDNTLPVLTDPVMMLEYTDAAGATQKKVISYPTDSKERQETFAREVEPLIGSIKTVRYEYPIDEDHFFNDIEPLMHQHNVQLVLHGHSHVWNRAKTGRVNFMETSNVANCFGAYWTEPNGTIHGGAQRASGYASFMKELAKGDASLYDPRNYPLTGDPHGREPIFPNLAHPEMIFGEESGPVPYVCSNNISVFSILDTKMGAVRSYAFDATKPDGEVVEFDRMQLD